MQFTLKNLEEFFQVRGDRLRQWQKRGWIPKPSIKRSERPGEANRYSFDDICYIGLFIHFVVWLYMTPQDASQLLRSVKLDELDNQPDLYVTTKFVGRIVANQIGPTKPKENEPGVLSVIEIKVKDLVKIIKKKARAAE